MVEDITDKKKAEEALRASEERLRLAQQAARIGAFDWNTRTGVNIWTPELEAMYGLPQGGFGGTQTAFENLVHVDDRAGVIKLVDAAMNSGQPTKGEWRVVWADGSVHWIAGRWQVFMDASGEPSKMIGVNIDVTEHKRAEEAIKESEMRFRRIVETTNEGVWLLDSKLHTSYVNRQMAGMLGYEPGDMVGRSVFDFYFSEDVDHKRQVLTRREQGVREQLEERLRRRDGSELWVRMSATPMFGEDSEFEGAFAMVCDITERKRAQERLLEYEKVVEGLAVCGKIVRSQQFLGWFKSLGSFRAFAV